MSITSTLLSFMAVSSGQSAALENPIDFSPACSEDITIASNSTACKSMAASALASHTITYIQHDSMKSEICELKKTLKQKDESIHSLQTTIKKLEEQAIIAKKNAEIQNLILENTQKNYDKLEQSNVIKENILILFGTIAATCFFYILRKDSEIEVITAEQVPLENVAAPTNLPIQGRGMSELSQIA